MTSAHTPAADDNQLITERREKLAAIRAQAAASGTAAFPNDFKPRHHAAELLRKHGGQSNERNKKEHVFQVRIAQSTIHQKSVKLFRPIGKIHGRKLEPVQDTGTELLE